MSQSNGYNSLFGYGVSPHLNIDLPSYLNSGVPAGSSPLGGYSMNQPQTGGGSFLDGMLGKDGWGGLALGGLQGLGNLFMGMQQYGLAKKTLKQNREQFEKNYGAQRQTVNTALEDRQRARIASNPGAYEPLSPYMDRNRVR